MNFGMENRYMRKRSFWNGSGSPRPASCTYDRPNAKTQGSIVGWYYHILLTWFVRNEATASWMPRVMLLFSDFHANSLCGYFFQLPKIVVVLHLEMVILLSDRGLRDVCESREIAILQTVHSVAYAHTRASLHHSLWIGSNEEPRLH